MRPNLRLHKTRRAQVALGALTLMVPASAYALTAGSTNAFAGPAQSAPQFKLTPRELAYGGRVTVTGSAPQDAGRRLALEFSNAAHGWRPLATTTVGTRGGFRFVAVLRRSAMLRLTGGTAVAVARASQTPVAAIAPSAPQAVRVSAQFAVSGRSINTLSGQTVHVHGHLMPGVGGRQVRLDELVGHGWRTLSSARTGRWGGFDLRYTAATTGHHRIRVRFPGDRANARVKTGAGWLTVYRPSVASWYNDGGNTACGFHATYGVANKVLPCGTKVTFSYNGRSVTATVDDRGPFVAGREWDLNQNTAGALGFGGVATVWSSI
jgi:hypothetical protein